MPADLDEVIGDPPPRRPAPAKGPLPTGLFGREMPHSLEAEEYLLSCVFIDGAETMGRCRAEALEAEAFFSPVNQKIFLQLLAMEKKGLPLDIDVLSEELKASGKLDEIGGYPYLMQVSSNIPTTAQAGYFVERVKGLHTLRKMIATAGGIVERAFSPGENVEEFMEQADKDFSQVVEHAKGKPAFLIKGASSYPYPEQPDENQMLGTQGWAKRGQGGLLVGPMGQGKSSIVYDMALTWCLGRSFPPRSDMAIPTRGKWKFVVVQAEDDDYYLGQVVGSYYAANNLTEEEREHCNRHVLFANVKGVRGNSFMAVVDNLVKTHRPDFVVINPLLMFMQGDPSDIVAAGEFLTGLDKINAKYDNCTSWIIVHHTGKPPNKENKSSDKMDWEVAYSGTGSSLWANWPRWVAVLEPRLEDGRYYLRLAKSGKKAGLIREYGIPQGAGERVVREAVTKLPIRHSQQTIDINGVGQPLYEWEADTDEVGEENPKGEKKKRHSGYSGSEIITYFPASDEEPLTLAEITRTANEGCLIEKGAMMKWREDFTADGMIVQSGKGYRRTAAGDDLARTALGANT